VLAAGFFIISFSYMVNLSTFGILACFATVVAFLSDILFAPALLLVFGGRDARSAGAASELVTPGTT